MSKYKAGDKVVMEITGVSKYGECYEVAHTSMWNTIRTERVTEPLSTYTEPLESKIKRQAAEITKLLAENKELKNEKQELTRERNQLMGRCGGLSAAKIKAFNNGRLAGQNEAWELAKKGMLMSSTDREVIFGSGFNAMYGVLVYHTYSEAAAKVAEWEKAKEKIKVGDIVSHEEKYGVVISEGTICFRGFTDDGTPFEWYKERCTKTGRHIDIDSFLKQIGGEQE